MPINPIDNVHLDAVTAASRPDPAVRQQKKEPAVDTPAPKPAPGWQSPQHEVNVVLDDNHNIVYRFVDKNTGEVVQQVPPEEALKMMRSIQELLQKSKRQLEVNL